MYTRRERGEDAAWLRSMRKSRWSNARVAVEEFSKATGHAIHYSRWAAYESGSKPIRDDDMDAFVAFFGAPVPTTSEPTATDLASAIRELTKAVRDQMAEAAEREARLTDRMVAVLEALALERAAAGNGDELHARPR